jgi:hypothetical protein
VHNLHSNSRCCASAICLVALFIFLANVAKVASKFLPSQWTHGVIEGFSVLHHRLALSKPCAAGCTHILLCVSKPRHCNLFWSGIVSAPVGACVKSPSTREWYCLLHPTADTCAISDRHRFSRLAAPPRSLVSIHPLDSVLCQPGPPHSGEAQPPNTPAKMSRPPTPAVSAVGQAGSQHTTGGRPVPRQRVSLPLSGSNAKDVPDGTAVDAPTPPPPSPAGRAQRSVRSVQCEACSAKCAVRSVQRATCNIQHATCRVQCATCHFQRARGSLQRAVCMVHALRLHLLS